MLIRANTLEYVQIRAKEHDQETSRRTDTYEYINTYAMHKKDTQIHTNDNQNINTANTLLYYNIHTYTHNAISMLKRTQTHMNRYIYIYIYTHTH